MSWIIASQVKFQTVPNWNSSQNGHEFASHKNASRGPIAVSHLAGLFVEPYRPNLTEGQADKSVAEFGHLDPL
jgi:hypothetical protein